MKRAAYILLLTTFAFFSGCSSGKPKNYVHVEFKDSRTGNFLLQAVSDSSLLLLDFRNDSTHVIPFQSISKFYLQGKETDLYSPEGIARLRKSIEPNKEIWHEK